MFAAALFAAVVVSASGCVHARWPAKTLADGVPIASKPKDGTITQLRAMPRPSGVDGFNATRVSQEQQLYRVRATLLRFSLATDGDVHLAIADPHDPAATMIAEIPDPGRMTGAPVRYRNDVARSRRDFIAEFGTPSFGVWTPVGQQIEITGPVFFDLLDGQAGGQAGGAPNAVEIHPVLSIARAGSSSGALLSPAESTSVDAIAARALHDYQIPGMSIAIVRNGVVAYARGYGYSNVTALRPAVAETQYQIGSVTKQFTAALVLQLAAQRRLSLDDPVTKFFPFFRSASKVSIRDLLGQRSGIADYNSAWMLVAAAPQLLRGAIGHEGLVRVIAGRSLAFRPDAMFQYSNSNYLLLGLIAERTTHKPLASLMEEQFFAPLGMRRTLLGTVAYCRGDAACGYSKTPLGVTAITPWKSDWTYSAGGVTSTAADLAKWDVALMSGRVLPPRGFAAMIRPRRDSGYGYGVFAYRQDGHWIVWHDGTVYGFKAMNSLVLPQRDGVIVLCNADYAHAAIVAMRIESVLFHIAGGSDERPDLQLPLFAFSVATGLALLPLAAMVAFRRRLVLGSLCAGLTYVGGIYFWPAGLALALAGIIIVCWKPAKEKSPPVMHVSE